MVQLFPVFTLAIFIKLLSVKTAKPWLNPKPKDETACQVEDEEGHDGYRHKEVNSVMELFYKNREISLGRKEKKYVSHAYVSFDRL